MDPASKSTDVFFLLTALALNSMTAPMTKLTQNRHGGYDYNKSCIYFFAELLKLGVAVTWCIYKVVTTGDRKYSFTQIDCADLMQYAIPGFVFFAQNNLSFIALQHMSSAAFQLLLNTRIAAVAVLTVVVLGKRLNQLEWASIALLMVGAMQYDLSACSKNDKMRISSTGIGCMGIIVACAALGNIYTQKVMQKKMDQPLMLQNAVLYGWGVLFNGVNWGNSWRHEPMYGSIEHWQVTSVIFYTIYGLSISVIIKEFGSLTRTFINTTAIMLTAMIDLIFFNAHLSLLE